MAFRESEKKRSSAIIHRKIPYYVQWAEKCTLMVHKIDGLLDQSSALLALCNIRGPLRIHHFVTRRVKLA